MFLIFTNQKSAVFFQTADFIYDRCIAYQGFRFMYNQYTQCLKTNITSLICKIGSNQNRFSQ